VSSYRSVDVSVRGGALRVGLWQSGDLGEQAPDRVVLAVHGITSSHRVWQIVATELTREPGVLVLAPDLRGRGRSSDLPGSWGMLQHAEDMKAVLDELAPDRAVVLAGHSMGGFVSVTLAARHPDRVASMVLVDGGIPLASHPGVSPREAAIAILGPAAERLGRTFRDHEEYRSFWRAHPAFADDFSPTIEAYVDYDLRSDGPPWRSSCALDAVTADFSDQFVAGIVDQLWSEVACPVLFIRAPRGLMNEAEGLYSPQSVKHWAAKFPQFSHHDVEDVNHYTILLSAAAAAVTADIATQLAIA
jgi:lipase